MGKDVHRRKSPVRGKPGGKNNGGNVYIQLHEKASCTGNGPKTPEAKKQTISNGIYNSRRSCYNRHLL